MPGSPNHQLAARLKDLRSDGLSREEWEDAVLKAVTGLPRRRLVHPALLYGGWVNLGKKGLSGERVGGIALGVPGLVLPSEPAEKRAQAVAAVSLLLVDAFPPAAVFTPKELGWRHAKVLVGLLLDLSARVAAHDIKVVAAEVANGSLFRQRIDQKDLRRMAGRDLPAPGAADILNDLRLCGWAAPTVADSSFLGCIPSIETAQEPRQWSGDMATLSLGDLVVGPFDGDLHGRSAVDIYWQSEILAWSWATARALANNGVVGAEAILAVRDHFLDESSPTVARNNLLPHLVGGNLDRLRAKANTPLERYRLDGLLCDVFGTKMGGAVKKLLAHAQRRTG